MFQTERLVFALGMLVFSHLAMRKLPEKEEEFLEWVYKSAQVRSFFLKPCKKFQTERA